MLMKFLIGGSIAALGLATAASAAQPAPLPPPGVAQGTAPVPMASQPRSERVQVMFGGDHVMSRDEVAKHIGEMFARLDTNHDGAITRQEVDSIHQKVEAAMVKAGDVEKRLAERGVFMGDRGAMFDRLDTNHDGNISRQEFMAKKPELREERVMIMRGDGAPGAPPMGGHPGMGMRLHAMGHMGMGMGHYGGPLFDMADANHDGRVTLAEAQALALAHFDKADLNHDGKITPDERQKGRQIMRFERRRG